MWENIKEYADLSNYEKIGNFHYLRYPGGDYSKGTFFREVIKEWNKTMDKPPAFVQHCERWYNWAGSKSNRCFLYVEGNMGGNIGIPTYMLGNSLAVESFPMIAAIAIRDICNKYAPGCYFSKFENDVVCREHKGKTCGIITVRADNYCCCFFGLNLVGYPPDEAMRKEGLHGCCLSKHTNNIPDMKTIFIDIGNRILEMTKEYDTIPKFVKLINDALCEYDKKTWYVEVNNPNGDPEKDGMLWDHDHPNACTKGYLNGKLLDVKSTYFDPGIYRLDKNHENFTPDVKKLAEEQGFTISKDFGVDQY